MWLLQNYSHKILDEVRRKEWNDEHKVIKGLLSSSEEIKTT